MLTYVIALLVFASVLTAFLGVRQLVRQNRRVPARLQTIRDEPGTFTHVADTLLDRPLPLYCRAVGVLGWGFPALAGSESLYWELARAGWSHPDAPRVFVGWRILATMVFGGAMALVGLHFPLRHQELLLLTGTMALLGFYAPRMYLAWKQRQRGQEILQALPDALDLMVICVEAGQGLNAALLSVGTEIQLRSPVLSKELKLINHEMRAGLSRAQSLRNFANRTGVDESRSLVAVLVQSDRLGTSMTQALRAHAQSLRTRRRQRAEEAARKIAVKLVFPLVFCIFPALLVVLLAPGMIQIIGVLAESAGR